MFLDDDLLPSAKAFEVLIAAFSADTNRIVGKWGRSQHVKPFYDTIDCDGLCDVVLTKFMIMRRADIGRFFDYATTMGMDRGLPGSTPVWNGEDIFMSLVNSHCKGVSHKHLAMPSLDVVPIASLTGSQNAISGDIPKDFRALIPSDSALVWSSCPLVVSWSALECNYEQTGVDPMRIKTFFRGVHKLITYT